jgi:hypothetical protein
MFVEFSKKKKGFFMVAYKLDDWMQTTVTKMKTGYKIVAKRGLNLS